MIDPDRIAGFIREIAATEIVPRYQTLAVEDIREKKPGDLVTTADVETERLLTRRLLEASPGSLVLGEEAAAADPTRFDLLLGEDPVWVIDPVDGTANFARGRPGFAVILALVRQGAVRAGWIYDPLGDVMAVAEQGSGAWSAGERLRVAAVPPPAMTGAAYGRTADGRRAAVALEASGRVAQVRNLGCSALEYVDIALGRTQFSLHSRSLPWDHAAGMLLVEEAGGVAGFLDGSAYDPRIATRAVLAASDAAARDAVRAVVGMLS